VIVWTAGLGLFAALLPTPPKSPLPGDCVAVASGEQIRLITAIDQYAGRADIFISGSVQGTNSIERDDMRAHAPTWFDGHVAFGPDASNTRENGYEIAAWARRHQCHELIVLTSVAHLPRLLLALDRAGYHEPVLRHAVSLTAEGIVTFADRLHHLALAWTRYLVALVVDW
jgi:hypothetical protein